MRHGILWVALRMVALAVVYPFVRLAVFAFEGCMDPDCPDCRERVDENEGDPPVCDDPNCPIHGRGGLIDLMAQAMVAEDCGDPDCPIHGDKGDGSSPPVVH